jgi:predicted transcriptional regulator
MRIFVLNFLIFQQYVTCVPVEGKHRNRFDIYCTLLDLVAAQEKIRKTRLMYKSNLSHTNTSSCLKKLTECDLLEFDEHDKSYKVTSKGLRFLELYKEMIKNLQS